MHLHQNYSRINMYTGKVTTKSPVRFWMHLSLLKYKEIKIISK